MIVNTREAAAAMAVIAKIRDLITSAIVAGKWSFDQIHYGVREWTIYRARFEGSRCSHRPKAAANLINPERIIASLKAAKPRSTPFGSGDFRV